MINCWEVEENVFSKDFCKHHRKNPNVSLN